MDVQNKHMNYKEIEKHHIYKITKPKGEKGRWSTYIKQPNGKRKYIAKTHKDDLYRFLAQHYNIDLNSKATLNTFFPTWLNHKMIYTNNTETLRRHKQHYLKYYKDSQLANMSLSKITKLDIEEFIHNSIKEHNLTSKELNNMLIILKGSLELACEMNLINSNPYNNIRINRRLCRHVVKKANTKEIYFEDEIKLLYEALDKELSENPDCSACLLIKFLFQTGLRISEATAIKFSDISDGDIYIRRMETRCSSYNPTDTSFSKSEFQVVEHTKTKNDAGCRYIPLTPTALDIIEQARHINETYGYATDDFIFCTKEGRITSRQVTYRLKKCCKKANIPFKSPHRIRKTFASTLCNSNLNIEIIRMILGHTNDTTTYNYIFNPHTDATTRKLFTDALK